MQKQKDTNDEIDREIEQFRQQFDDVQAELLTLDQQIADYEEMICRKDDQIEGMRDDLADAERKKRSEEETYKQ